MAKTIEQIQEEVQQIKNETVAKQNTATRVGGALEDMVEKMEADSIEVEGKFSDVNKKVGKLPYSESTSENVNLAFADKDGNVSMQIVNDGDFETKNFKSALTPKAEEIENAQFAYAVADKNGNIAFAVDFDGNCFSKLFDSRTAGQGGGGLPSDFMSKLKNILQKAIYVEDTNALINNL